MNKDLRQHQIYAETGDVPGIVSVENSFKSGPNHGAPARGTLLDSQRGRPRAARPITGNTATKLQRDSRGVRVNGVKGDEDV